MPTRGSENLPIKKGDKQGVLKLLNCRLGKPRNKSKSEIDDKNMDRPTAMEDQKP